MANIKRIDGKTGPSFKITVTNGTDHTGKQVRHYRTWKPAPGMTERQMERAVQKAALDFEREIEQGYEVDARQTFAQYCEYVISEKERAGCKHRTIERYQDLTRRIYPAIGHLKLSEIRPQHLNQFYRQLQTAEYAGDRGRATARGDLRAIFKAAKLSQEAAADRAGVSKGSVSAACRGDTISAGTARAIAAALKEKPEKLFTFTKDAKTLSNKTVLEYHRLIRTVLAQAEKEMLVPYNAAAKATPPKQQRGAVSYYQPQELAAILDALDTEPLKWRLMVHLLIVTGCRRGEIAGLKWEKIDFKQRTVRIDSSLLYSPKRGLYEDSTKTGNTRLLYLPDETIQILKAWRTEYLTLQLANGDRWENSGYVFVKDNGAPMNPDSLTAWLKKFSERHGLPHIHPHAFRHTVASVLIANGTDVVTVSKQLGHANATTTESIYAHMIEENKARAAECIADSILRRTKEAKQA